MLDGDTLLDSEAGVALPPEARGLGCVLQRPCLFPHMTVHQNCLYGAYRRALPVPAQRAGQVLKWLDLAQLLPRRPAGLSGGEQQRVALARALLSQPRLLLLDEPLAAVDARRRDEVLPYLEQVCFDAGVPVIYVSHAIDDVARLADRVIVLHNGRVSQVGSAQAVLGRGVADVGFDAVNVLDGVLESAAGVQGDSPGVGSVRVGNVCIAAAVADVPPGARVRMVVRADDVHVALDAPKSISADNVLPGRVVACLAPQAGMQTVVLECDGLELSASVSLAACNRLTLRPGEPAYALLRAPRARRRGLQPQP